MPKDKKSNRNICSKVKIEQSTRKTIDIFNSGLYHKVTISSRERCNSSSLQYVVQDNIFHSNNRKNINRRVSKIF